MDYLPLFESVLHKIRRAGSQDQYIALCPYHKDKNPSFSFNAIVGVWNCKSCGKRGNAYQIAKDFNMDNLTQYISDSNGTYIEATPKYTPPTYDIDFEKLYSQYIDNLKKKNTPLINDFKKVMIDMGIGFDDTGNLVYSMWRDGKIYGFHYHKKGWKPLGLHNHWYPSHRILSYSDDKTIYVCEGLKDTIPLRYVDLQAISNTGGALSIPKIIDENNEPTQEYDLAYFKNKKDIVVTYDNDDAGYGGAEKLAKEMRDVYPINKSIKIAQWEKSLPKGWDIWDSFEKDNARSWYQAIANAKIVEEKTKGFKTFKLGDFLMEEYTPTTPVIESIAYNNQTTLLFGDTGSKKSFIALQCALSIASGVPLFGHFKTTKKKVVVIQFENENFDMQERLKTMIPYFIKKSGNSDWIDDIEIVPLQRDNDQFVNNWIKIDETLERLNLDNCVMILDNLYTSTDRELSDNHEATRLLQEVNRVKVKHNGTFIMIGHSTKGVVLQKQLDKDQSQGGKTIVNWMANVVSVDYSRISQDLNIMKIVKGGRSSKNELLGIPFKLHWSDDSCTFRKGAIIKSEVVHFTGDTEKWEIKLIKDVASQPRIINNDSFDREMFREALPKDYQDMNETKITRFFEKLIEWGLMKKIAHNKYQIDRGNLSDFC
jgi:hypothetical protein